MNARTGTFATPCIRALRQFRGRIAGWFRARGETSRAIDGFTLFALALHAVVLAILLLELPSDASSGLEGGGLGGGSQMMELTLGGPGGKRAATPRPPADAQASPTASAVTPPQARDVKPDAKAVSTRKRANARQPRPAEQKPLQMAAATVPPALQQPPAVTDDAQGSPTGSGEQEGSAPGSGGTDKGVAFGAGGGTGGGSSGKSGPGGEGFGADGAGGDGGYDRKPRALYAPRPPYPAEARNKGVEGVVVVRLRIDTRGRVVASRVVGGEAADMFADTTLSTVERWRFRPCGRDGRDVSCEVEVPVMFQMAR